MSGLIEELERGAAYILEANPGRSYTSDEICREMGITPAYWSSFVNDALLEMVDDGRAEIGCGSRGIMGADAVVYRKATGNFASLWD